MDTNRIWNILSLFDGISCAQLALNQIGITNYNYNSSEIDTYAMKITEKHFPNTIQLGSVVDWKDWKLPKLDLIIAGFPCQDLSVAKKGGKGLEGERSGLFWYFKDILDFYNPRYFVGENVESMKTKDFVIISNALGVKPVMLDAAKVSAQRRKRYFWTNIPNVKQPKLIPSRLFPDNKIGLVIADILEPNVERKIVNVDPDRIIKTSYGVRWNVNKTSVKARLNQSSESHKPYEIQTKCRTIEASRTISKQNIVGRNCEAHRLYALHNKHAVVVGSRTNSKTNIVHNSQQNRAYDVELKHKPIPAFRTSNMCNVVSEYKIEQLTWTEVERLQGLPDSYSDLGEGNNKQEHRGRAIGNGFQIDIIKHLLSFMLDYPKPLERSNARLFGEQPNLF